MNYQWDAADYEQHSSPQHQWARDILRTIDFAGDERVLDIGCGDGKVTAELAALVPRGSVLGIDSSDVMIQFAHRRFPPSRFPNLQFRLGDATCLAYDHEFDLIVSFASLHWVRDHIAVLNGIKGGLRPLGRAVLQFGGKDNAASLFGVTNEIITHERWRSYFVGFTESWAFYSVEEYVSFLAYVGLTARRVELVPKDMAHHGKEELKGWVRTVFLPYTACLPEALREDLIEEIAITYIERHPPDNEGRVHVQMIRLEVEATL
jgi:trans-aconitate 2-methyltransferase